MQTKFMYAQSCLLRAIAPTNKADATTQTSDIQKRCKTIRPYVLAVMATQKRRPKRPKTIRPFVLAVIVTLNRSRTRVCSVCFDEVAQGHGAACAGDEEHLCCSAAALSCAASASAALECD